MEVLAEPDLRLAVSLVRGEADGADAAVEAKPAGDWATTWTDPTDDLQDQRSGNALGGRRGSGLVSLVDGA